MKTEEIARICQGIASHYILDDRSTEKSVKAFGEAVEAMVKDLYPDDVEEINERMTTFARDWATEVLDDLFDDLKKSLQGDDK